MEMARCRLELAGRSVGGGGADGEGADVEGGRELIRQLDECRVLLEKLRNAGRKVKYSVDKAIREEDGKGQGEWSIIEGEKLKERPRLAGGKDGGKGEKEGEEEVMRALENVRGVLGGAGGLESGRFDSSDDDDDNNDDNDDNDNDDNSKQNSVVRRSRPNGSSSSLYVPPRMSSSSVGGGAAAALDDSATNASGKKRRKVHSSSDYSTLRAMSEIVASSSGRPEVAGVDGTGEGRAGAGPPPTRLGRPRILGRGGLVLNT